MHTANNRDNNQPQKKEIQLSLWLDGPWLGSQRMLNFFWPGRLLPRLLDVYLQA